MGALARLNLALKILTGRHVPTRSEIESLKSSLRVASQMSAKEIASAVIHQELSRNRALRKGVLVDDDRQEGRSRPRHGARSCFGSFMS
jgi:hypothetical protein